MNVNGNLLQGSQGEPAAQQPGLDRARSRHEDPDPKGVTGPRPRVYGRERDPVGLCPQWLGVKQRRGPSGRPGTRRAILRASPCAPGFPPSSRLTCSNPWCISDASDSIRLLFRNWVGDPHRGGAAEVLHRADMRVDPVRQLLGSGRLGVGEAAGAEHRDEPTGRSSPVHRSTRLGRLPEKSI